MLRASRARASGVIWHRGTKAITDHTRAAVEKAKQAIHETIAAI